MTGWRSVSRIGDGVSSVPFFLGRDPARASTAPSFRRAGRGICRTTQCRYRPPCPQSERGVLAPASNVADSELEQDVSSGLSTVEDGHLHGNEQAGSRSTTTRRSPPSTPFATRWSGGRRLGCRTARRRGDARIAEGSHDGSGARDERVRGCPYDSPRRRLRSCSSCAKRLYSSLTSDGRSLQSQSLIAPSSAYR